MARITDIRMALCDVVVGGLRGIAVSDRTVYFGADIAGSVRAIPALDEFADGAGMDMLGFNVQLTTGRADDHEAQARLDELLDPDGGVRGLLEADRRLGGLVADLAVKRCSGYQAFPDQDGDMLGATWFVRCAV